MDSRCRSRAARIPSTPGRHIAFSFNRAIIGPILRLIVAIRTCQLFLTKFLPKYTILRSNPRGRRGSVRSVSKNVF